MLLQLQWGPKSNRRRGFGIRQYLSDMVCAHLTLRLVKVTDLKCKGGTPYPMSVKEGTIKKDPAAKARDLPAPDGGVVTPAELRQMKKDARRVPRPGGLPRCGGVPELDVQEELDLGMAYVVRHVARKRLSSKICRPV